MGREPMTVEMHINLEATQSATDMELIVCKTGSKSIVTDRKHAILTNTCPQLITKLRVWIMNESNTRPIVRVRIWTRKHSDYSCTLKAVRISEEIVRQTSSRLMKGQSAAAFIYNQERSKHPGRQIFVLSFVIFRGRRTRMRCQSLNSANRFFGINCKFRRNKFCSIAQPTIYTI